MSHYKASLHDISKLSKNIRIAFVTAEFNLEHTKAIESQNMEFFRSHGFENMDTFLVPGAFELPGFARRVVRTGHYDLVIAIGVVIRGDTPHFDYVCNEASRGIMDLNLTCDTPVIFGVLTCNTEAQVLERIGPNFAIAGLNLLAAYKTIHHANEE